MTMVPVLAQSENISIMTIDFKKSCLSWLFLLFFEIKYNAMFETDIQYLLVVLCLWLVRDFWREKTLTECVKVFCSGLEGSRFKLRFALRRD